PPSGAVSAESVNEPGAASSAPSAKTQYAPASRTPAQVASSSTNPESLHATSLVASSHARRTWTTGRKSADLSTKRTRARVGRSNRYGRSSPLASRPQVAFALSNASFRLPTTRDAAASGRAPRQTSARLGAAWVVACRRYV